MDFSFDKFYQLNRRLFIWVLLFALIWLLRDFFGLIFLTFVLAFISQPLIQYAQRWLRLPRRPAIVVVHLLFLCTFVSIMMTVTPRVVREASVMIGNVPQLEEKLLQIQGQLEGDYPALVDAIPGYLESALSEGGPDSPVSHDYRAEYNAKLGRMLADLPPLTENDVLLRDDIAATDTAKLALLVRYDERRNQLLVNTFLTQQLDVLRDQLPGVFNILYGASVTLLLALLFSFLIQLDIARLGREVKSLSSSRLRDFYNQTAQPVVRFTYVVGRAIRAQAMIAVINTTLTLLGLYVLDIASLMMLSFVVFFCSFIPVLGVFISTIPILVIALNTGGLPLAVSVVAMVIGIHLIAAYLLNPLIYGQHFKINPVVVLIILFIGHHMFGLWGMVLGVPVAYYFIHDVFGVPIWDERKLSPVEPAEGRPARPLSALNRPAGVPGAADQPPLGDGALADAEPPVD